MAVTFKDLLHNLVVHVKKIERAQNFKYQNTAFSLAYFELAYSILSTEPIENPFLA